MISSQFLFIAGVILITFVLKWKYPKIKGTFGEWQVKLKLKRLGESYTSFHDLYIPTKKGGFTQVDHIVTSPYGIFVIETKHYNGWIFGDEFKPYWTQVIYKKKFKMYNPIRQNYGHVQSLVEYLDEIDEEAVYSIIAFSAQSTFKFKKPFKTAEVIQFSQLIKVIHTYKEPCISSETIRKINIQLESLVVKNKTQKRQIKREHIRTIQEARNEKAKKRTKPASVVKDESVLQKSCPKCQGILQLKYGRYGKFYGCTRYPNCRHTENA